MTSRAAYMAASRCMDFDAGQYIRWMGEQWRAWAAETGTHVDGPLTDAQHDAFEAWLTDRAGAMA